MLAYTGRGSITHAGDASSYSSLPRWPWSRRKASMPASSSFQRCGRRCHRARRRRPSSDLDRRDQAAERPQPASGLGRSTSPVPATIRFTRPAAPRRRSTSCSRMARERRRACSTRAAAACSSRDEAGRCGSMRAAARPRSGSRSGIVAPASASRRAMSRLSRSGWRSRRKLCLEIADRGREVPVALLPSVGRQRLDGAGHLLLGTGGCRFRAPEDPHHGGVRVEVAAEDAGGHGRSSHLVAPDHPHVDEELRLGAPHVVADQCRGERGDDVRVDLAHVAPAVEVETRPQGCPPPRCPSRQQPSHAGRAQAPVEGTDVVIRLHRGPASRAAASERSRPSTGPAEAAP